MCRAWACKCNILWLKNTFPSPAQHLGRTGSCTTLDTFVQWFVPYLQRKHLFQMGTRCFHIRFRDRPVFQLGGLSDSFLLQIWHFDIDIVSSMTDWVNSVDFKNSFLKEAEEMLCDRFFCHSVKEKCSSFLAMYNEWLKWSSWMSLIVFWCTV